MPRIVDGRLTTGWQYNPYKMHVCHHAARTLGSGGYTTIVFDTVVYDTVGDDGVTTGYNTGTGEYKVPLSGYYTMGAIVNVVMPAVVAAQITYISLFVNGTEQRRGHGETFINTGPIIWTISSMLSNSDYYNAGDVLTIQCYSQSGGANPSTPSPGDKEVYWTMHLISA